MRGSPADQLEARRAYDALGDDALASWDVVSRMYDWENLLLGNGASIAMSTGFSYGSIFEQATGHEGRLAPHDRQLFDAFATTNFEAVLRALRTAATVNQSLGIEVTAISDRYEAIRHALIDTVHAVHIDWPEVKADALSRIKAEFLAFESVFTTNYDLIAYWAAMNEEVGGNIPDYFWTQDGIFDRFNTEIWGKKTRIVHLHGGLHLVRLSDGRTLKRKASTTETLLDSFGDELPAYPGAVPLFVSEGTSEDKLSAIRTSDYLSFALGEFSKLGGSLVVFGHSLGPEDQHLVDRICALSQSIPIAISMMPTGNESLSARKSTFRAQLRGRKVTFFDATSHPLGRGNVNEW